MQFGALYALVPVACGGDARAVIAAATVVAVMLCLVPVVVGLSELVSATTGVRAAGGARATMGSVRLIRALGALLGVLFAGMTVMAGVTHALIGACR
ncbi:MAG: hypothetical protein AB7O92_24370 [Acidimicrobiia bacterium]